MRRYMITVLAFAALLAAAGIVPARSDERGPVPHLTCGPVGADPDQAIAPGGPGPCVAGG